MKINKSLVDQLYNPNETGVIVVPDEISETRLMEYELS